MSSIISYSLSTSRIRDGGAGRAGWSLATPLFARTTFRFQKFKFLGEDGSRPPYKLATPSPQLKIGSAVPENVRSTHHRQVHNLVIIIISPDEYIVLTMSLQLKRLHRPECYCLSRHLLTVP